jgi:hypothetical protein
LSLFVNMYCTIIIIGTCVATISYSVCCCACLYIFFLSTENKH